MRLHRQAEQVSACRLITQSAIATSNQQFPVELNPCSPALWTDAVKLCARDRAGISRPTLSEGDCGLDVFHAYGKIPAERLNSLGQELALACIRGTNGVKIHGVSQSDVLCCRSVLGKKHELAFNVASRGFHIATEEGIGVDP